MNNIGLDKTKSLKLAENLNELLASYMVFYQNTRGLHWNIKGSHFFVLHEKYEELYDGLEGKIDEIAERILTIGATPLHSFEDYIKVSKIQSAKDVSDGDTGVKLILSSFEILLAKQREILEQAGDASDEGTAALMGDYISEQEKLVWMFSSYLG